MIDNTNFDSTIDRENELWLLIRQANNLIYRELEYELSQLGSATYSQVSVLWVVKAIGDEATPAEISR